MKLKLKFYLDLVRWDRPAGWLLLLWPTLSALWLAAQDFPSWHLLLVFIAGTILMRSAGCCINDVADRGFDKHVQRTQQRPVTSGQISPREALIVGALLALLAFLLVLTLSLKVIIGSVLALAVTVIYPFTKRWFSMPQAILGLAFGMGIPMAFLAVQDTVPIVAWLLMLSNFFWVLAYDTEYAMVDREDDLRIGIRTSAITLGRWDVLAIMIFYVAALVLWLAAMNLSGLAWRKGILLAMFVAGLQVILHYRWIRSRNRQGCWRAFRLNHWLGFTLFLGIVWASAGQA